MKAKHKTIYTLLGGKVNTDILQIQTQSEITSIEPCYHMHTYQMKGLSFCFILKTQEYQNAVYNQGFYTLPLNVFSSRFSGCFDFSIRSPVGDGGPRLNPTFYFN